MKIRNLIFYLLLYFIFLNICYAKSKKVPLWTSYETIYKIFPETDFIARIGTGKNEDSAKINADSELSLYFSANVKNTISSSENYLNDNDITLIQKQFSKNILLEGNSELFALRHTDYFYDKKRKTVIICAYISKKEAWNLIEPKLSAISNSINSLYSASQNQKENFLKILQLNSVLQKSDEFYNLYFFTMEIIPQKAKEFFFVQEIIKNTKNEILKLKQESAIFVNVQGDSFGRIKNKITEFFFKNGFSVAILKNEKFSYIANVTVNTDVLENNDFFVCYPQISIFIKNASGETLLSFFKNYEKIASYTKESCKQIALAKLENEINKNVILK